MALEFTTSPEMLAKIADRYRGRDLTEADRDRLIVHVIAEAFGVHPNSIYIWAKRFRWRRPAWYDARRPKRRGRRPAVAIGTDLLAAIGRAAAAGAPCPSNVAFARALDASTEIVVQQMRRLRRAGTIRSERAGPRRRLVLQDGRATEWTRVADPRPPGLFHLAGERRSRLDLDERLTGVLQDLARRGLPMPGNVALGAAIGCAKSSVRRVIARRVAVGAFTVELAGHERRVTFPDGAATPWAAELARASFDPAVRDAIAILRRHGDVTVFDLAIRTARAWGVAWFLNGRTVGRAELLSTAAARQARALEQLQAAA